ncbi:hypothetical protein Ancab_026437 [Ancistrocladus abbreviatus]
MWILCNVIMLWIPQPYMNTHLHDDLNQLSFQLSDVQTTRTSESLGWYIAICSLQFHEANAMTGTVLGSRLVSSQLTLNVGAATDIVI